jgi:hypothetical protein
VQIAGLGSTFAQFAAECREMDVDGLILHIRLAPDVGEELPPGDHLVGMGRQIGEQIEFAAGQP